MVTRSEGYRRGVPKEEEALQVVESFLGTRRLCSTSQAQVAAARR